MGDYIKELNALVKAGKISKQEALELAKAARKEYVSHMRAWCK